MAQGTLKNPQELVKKAMDYSKSGIVGQAVQGFRDFGNLLASKVSKKYTALSGNKLDLIDGILKATSSNSKLFDAGCFDRDVLGSLNEKQLKAISAMVSKMEFLYDQSQKLQGSSTYLAEKNRELVETYKQAVDEMSPYFEGVNLTKIFGKEAISSQQSEFNTTIPTKSDLELVEAFRQIGVPLTRHVKNSGIEWRYDEKASSADSFEKMFRFSEKEVEAFTQGYLNKPLNERGGRVITPSALFRVYRERGNSLIKDNKSLEDAERRLLNTNFQEKCNGLATEGKNWEFGLLSSKEYIAKLAQSVALSEIAHDSLSGFAQSDSVETRTKIEQSLEENELYQASRSRDQRKLSNRVLDAVFASGGCSDTITENIPDSSLGQVEARYDRLLENLENQQQAFLAVAASPEKLGEVERQILILKQAKENFLMSVEFLKQYAKSNGNSIADAKQSVEDLKFASGRYTIQSNNGGFVVVDRNSGVLSGDVSGSPNKSKAVDALKAAILAKAGKKASVDMDSSIEESAEKLSSTGILDYFMEDEDDKFGFAQSMSDMAKLKIAQILFEEGAPLDIMAVNYFHENPNKTIDDFINEKLPMVDEDENLFDRKSVTAALEERWVAHGIKKQMSPESQAHINNVNENYGKNLVLLARVLDDLTEEETAKLQNPTLSSDVKSKLIKGKILAAKAKGPITAVRGDKEYDSAMTKYNNKLLGSLLSSNMDAIKEAEKADGADGIMSNVIQKYIDKIDPENQTQQQPKKDEFVAYGSLRPRSVDLVKFEKAMKGYSSKELKKKFIKPLLKALKETMFNMTAYNERMNQLKQQEKSEDDQQERTVDQKQQQAPDPNQQPQRPVNDPSNTQQTNPQDQNNPPVADDKVLRKRELEASTFLPALCLTEKAIADINDPTSNKLGPLNNVKDALQMLTSIDNLGNQYSTPIADGSDFRDACRGIAFDICKGVLKDPQAVQDRLTQTMATYSIPNSPYTQRLLNGFSNLTPELMNYLIEFSSTGKKVPTPDGKVVNIVTIGDKLPRGLDACDTDQKRHDLIDNYMKKNLKDYELGKDLLSHIITEVYAQRGVGDGFGKPEDIIDEFGM